MVIFVFICQMFHLGNATTRMVILLRRYRRSDTANQTPASCVFDLASPSWCYALLRRLFSVQSSRVDTILCFSGSLWIVLPELMLCSASVPSSVRPSSVMVRRFGRVDAITMLLRVAAVRSSRTPEHNHTTAPITTTLVDCLRLQNLITSNWLIW